MYNNCKKYKSRTESFPEKKKEMIRKRGNYLKNCQKKIETGKKRKKKEKKKNQI